MTRTTTLTLGLGLAVLALGTPVEAKGKLGGKVYVAAERPKDVSLASLERQFANASAKSELRREKGGHWIGTMVAFFRKPSAQGPITVWLYDKADKQALKDREPIHQFSVDSTPKEAFVHEIDFDPDNGFNKEKSYLVMVGQLINKKEKIYATGEVKLLK